MPEHVAAFCKAASDELKLALILAIYTGQRQDDLRKEPAPPEPHSFMAEIDTAHEQRIFDLPQREQITDVHHYRDADSPSRLRLI